ncbi:hypothetical protein Slin15195_G033450 [Septoria linicola]|uniref:Uncharacterized protein n=1 Tax=Septoria linicola TaxID=215465 RepID=A0A9Q9EFQ7_9PEZI|nr:hypothetical protein Slin15195_G033450 [Septoria linicola]
MPGIANGAQDAQPVTATWTPTADEQADLDVIDAKVQRMRDHITLDPYVMTIPQDVEPRYHHHYEAQAKQWLYSTPFEEGEHEATQYLTFHYHEPGKEMYMLHNSRPMKGSSTDGGQEKARPGTGANTPSTGVKKKISFSAYKKGKQAGDSGPSEHDAAADKDALSKQPAVKGPVERVKAETQEMLAAVAEDSEQDQKVQKEKSPEQGDLKRKRQASSEAHKQEGRPIKSEAGSSSKRQRTDSESTRKDVVLKQIAEKIAQRTGAAHSNKLEGDFGLPPRLSPGMPPRLSPGLPDKLSPLQHDKVDDLQSVTDYAAESVPATLPSRLSPTIPENIAKVLGARAHAPNATVSSTIIKDKEGKLTPLKRSEGVTKHKSPAPRNGYRASSSSPAVRTDVDAKVAMTTNMPKFKGSDSSQEEEIVVAKASKAKKVDKVMVEEKPTLVVRLKYKRARREDILRILKMRSRPDKSMLLAASTTEAAKTVAKPFETRIEDRKEETGKTKGVAQKVGPARKEKDKKPSREESSERQPDKSISKASEKRPAKPTEKPASPKRKPEDDKQAPPPKRRKLEPTDARREPSTPAQRDVASPAAPRSGQHNTPGTRKDLLSQAMKREQSQDSNATHTPPATSSTPSVNGSNHPNGINRPPSSQPSSKTPRQNAFEVEQKRYETLGRELKHSASAHSNNPTPTPNDQKLAAVKSIESFLCYLVAFTCADEAASSADPKQAPVYRTWRSLTGLYAFVKRLSDPFGPLSGLISSLGVVFNARVLEISTLLPEPPSQGSLIDTAMLLHRAVASAEEKLDLETLQDVFPRSWKERTRRLPTTDKLETSKFGGPYKLPIGIATTPLRAARAGHAMLREYLDKERLDYILKLKL